MRKQIVLSVAAMCCLAADPVEAAKKWRTYEECVLRENPANDGDSFHVKWKRRHYLFRLYFVDACETDKSLPDRIKEQAEYFGIDENQVVQAGKAATKFMNKFLENGFTAYSKLQDARGRSAKDRDYAIIRVGDKDLGEELVRNGLARIHGVGVDLPDGTSQKAVWWRLKSAEREAQKEKRGAWGMAGGSSLRFDDMNPPPEISEQEWTLPRSIAVYSTQDPTRQVGILRQGADVRILRAETVSLIRIRFTTGEGKAYEALCRREDIGI